MVNLRKIKGGNKLNSVPVFDVNGNFRRLEQLYEKIPFNRLTVASTRNTTVTCRICFGKGQIISKTQHQGYIENTCPHCNGTGLMRSI